MSDDDTKNTDGNVISITKGQKKPKTSGVMTKIMPYVDALLGLPSRDFDLPESFGVIQLDQRVRLLVEVDRQLDVIAPVNREGVADCLMRFSKNTTGLSPLDPDHASKAVKFWQANAKPIPFNSIAAVRPLSEKGYCWHRLPFDLKQMPTPHFDEMFQRMTNAVAVKQWIGSLLDPKADRQHYVWFHGEGGDGKGALSRCLKKTLGPGYKAENPPSQSGERFWTHGLIGARLVVFPDCNNAGFPASGLCKSLTGGDAVRFEEKGGKTGTVELACLLMFISNEKPNLSSEKADTRRIIYAEITPLDESKIKRLRTEIYDEKLWREAPGFLWECKRLYDEMRAKDIGFAIDSGVIENIIADNEAPLAEFFHTHLEKVALLPPDPKTGNEVTECKQPYVSAADLQKIMRRVMRWSHPKHQSAFLRWLERAQERKSQKVALPEKQFERRYLGLKLTERGAAVAAERKEFF